MRRVEQEAFKRNEPDRIAQMRIKIFTIVKTYIDMQFDDSDIVEYVSKKFNIDSEQAELEILVAKAFYDIFRY